MPRIVPATPDHALVVGRAMREADREEVFAATGSSPLVATLRALEVSALAWAAVDNDDVPFTIFGVAPYVGVTGSPWLLATDAMYQHRAFFLKHTRPIVRAMHSEFPVLLNHVDARHRDSVRWLQWAGFTLEQPTPYGVAQLPFHRFSKVNHV